MLLQAVEHSWDTSTLCENVSSKILFLGIVKHIESFWDKEMDSVSLKYILCCCSDFFVFAIASVADTREYLL